MRAAQKGINGEQSCRRICARLTACDPTVPRIRRKTRSVMKGGALLSLGNASGAAFSLVRNVVIARLLLPEEFGVASTFAITLALLETLGNIAVNRLLIQADDGDDPALQANLQAIQFARGVVGAALVLLIAEPYAQLMGAPEAAWAYRVMALVPLVRGLWHLDIFREQRRLTYKGFVFATVGSQAIATIAIAPLAMISVDYSLMLWTILIQQSVFTAISHIVAERRFSVRWSGAVFERSLRFGLPLLGNGLLIFAIFHGDRVLIANQVGLAELGWFSVAFMLTLAPAMVLNNTLTGLFLPRVANVKSDQDAFEAAAARTVQAAMLTGAVFATGFAIAGPPLLLLLFGAPYSPALDVLVLLALMQGVRLAKAGPIIVSIARGDTMNPPLANTARAAMLPLALAALWLGFGLVSIVLLALLGEALAFAVSMYRARHRVQMPVRRVGLGVAATSGFLLTIGLSHWANAGGAGLFDHLTIVEVLAPIGCAALIIAMPDLSSSLRNAILSKGKLSASERPSPSEPSNS